MNKIILTSVNGGFTWKLNDGTTDLTNPVRIDCDSSPRISKDPRCNDDNNMKYVIMDEEDRILTNPVLEDGFELDGTAILPNDLLTFLNGVCPAAAGVGGDASAANQLTGRLLSVPGRIQPGTFHFPEVAWNTPRTA